MHSEPYSVTVVSQQHTHTHCSEDCQDHGRDV